MCKTILGAAWFVFTGSAAFGQAPATKLAFEVASVKPAGPLPNGGGRSGPGGEIAIGMRGGPGTTSPGQINYTYVTLKQVLMATYGVKNYQITGPGWLDDERYDIVAKVPPDATKEQLNQMLQSLLAERFNLTFHRDAKELPVYELTVGKGGSKLKESVEDPSVPAMAPGTPLRSLIKNGVPQLPEGRAAIVGVGIAGLMRVAGRVQPLSALINMIENQLGRPVVDKTGLAAKYDFNLDFSTEGLAGSMGRLTAALPPPPGGPGGAPEPVAGDGGPSIFEAFDKQLGLKLEAKKDPIDLLVLDRVDKVPTDN